MACCLPFTVSVGVGWGSHSWLTPEWEGLGTSMPFVHSWWAGSQRWMGTPTFCPQSLAVVQVPGPLMGSWVGQVGKGGPVTMPLGPCGAGRCHEAT